MQIKRFTGSDMRQAMRRARDTFGLGAVMLSNRTLAEQVPEDLHPAPSQDQVSRIVAIMQGVDIGEANDPVTRTISGMAAHAHG